MIFEIVIFEIQHYNIINLPFLSLSLSLKNPLNKYHQLDNNEKEIRVNLNFSKITADYY